MERNDKQAKTCDSYRSREGNVVLRSELTFRFGVSSSRAFESSSSELMAMDSRDRGEPALLCADDADQ